MPRNQFTNPRTGEVYPWEINHSEEEESGKTRSIQSSANTANTGLVKQQGDTEPLRFRYSGTILTLAHFTEMKNWFQLCESQTIYFTDFAGDQYEVLVTSFRPTRRRTVWNPRDKVNCPHHYWTYSIELEVIRVISGSWSGVTP